MVALFGEWLPIQSKHTQYSNQTRTPNDLMRHHCITSSNADVPDDALVDVSPADLDALQLCFVPKSV